MKYIKTFETICIKNNAEKENYIKEKQEELLDFCKYNLIYLTDIGFKLHVHDLAYSRSTVWLKNRGGYFTWDEIKYDYLVFLEMLKSKYDLYSEKGNLNCISFISKSNTSHKDFSYEHIMNDEYCVGVNKDLIVAIGVSIKTYSYREKVVDSEIYL